MADESKALEAGIMLADDRYHIEDTLGEGGSGITYLANDERLERSVAIKECFYPSCSRIGKQVKHPGSMTREDWKTLLSKSEQEAKTVAGLDHPSIVTIFDVFRDNNTVYMVMKYIDGTNLEQRRRENGGTLPEDEVVRYAAQIGDALSLLHTKNVLHRDVTPRNIMLDKQGNAILIDFGAARGFVPGEKVRHTVMGTPGFAPPEQHLSMDVTALSDEWSPTSDVYSLAATCYYLLTGVTFDKHKPANIKNMSDEMWAAIQRGLVKNRPDRAENVTSFVEGLRSAIAISLVPVAINAAAEEIKLVGDSGSADVEEVDIAEETTQLTSIVMTAPDDGWIVGQGGVILRYRNADWVEVPSPTDAWLGSLCMISPDEGCAVGEDGTILNYRRGRWVGTGSPTDQELVSVDMFSTTSALASGPGLILERTEGEWYVITEAFNPKEGYAEELKGMQINGVCRISESEGWAVGGNGLILHYSEGGWDVFRSPVSKNLTCIHMISADFGWIAGEAGIILYFSGKSWLKVPTTTSKDLYGIHMLDHNEGWVVGEDGIILHYDGNDWLRVKSPTSDTLYSISSSVSEEAWAVSDKGYILHYKDGEWKTDRQYKKQVMSS